MHGHGLRNPGVLAALGAAFLFGSGAPIAKLLLSGIDPWLMAGLIYLGSGLCLALYRAVTHAPAAKLPKGDRPWLWGAILSGGVIAPVLFMFGLTGMAASEASLLLNAEGVFTALLAWAVFHENFDRRIMLGMIAIVAGAVILSWPSQTLATRMWPGLAVVAACLAWGLDNNLTRHVSMVDATWIAALKGLSAGSVNLALAFIMGAGLPGLAHIGGALLVGGLAYGVSLSLFVISLRYLGTARTGAYFSVAPFFGAALAMPLLGEPLSLRLVSAGACMALGVWLHLSEQHIHLHRHAPTVHDHEHAHAGEHQHPHDHPIQQDLRHRHEHRHGPITHSHAHYPDTKHRHRH